MSQSLLLILFFIGVIVCVPGAIFAALAIFDRAESVEEFSAHRHRRHRGQHGTKQSRHRSKLEHRNAQQPDHVIVNDRDVYTNNRVLRNRPGIESQAHEPTDVTVLIFIFVAMVFLTIFYLKYEPAILVVLIYVSVFTATFLVAAAAILLRRRQLSGRPAVHLALFGVSIASAIVSVLFTRNPPYIKMSNGRYVDVINYLRTLRPPDALDSLFASPGGLESLIWTAAGVGVIILLLGVLIVGIAKRIAVSTISVNRFTRTHRFLVGRVKVGSLAAAAIFLSILALILTSGLMYRATSGQPITFPPTPPASSSTSTTSERATTAIRTSTQSATNPTASFKQTTLRTEMTR